MFSPTVEPAPYQRANKNIKGLTAIVAAVIIALWAVVAVSSITARGAAMDHARAEAHNLAAAFASEVSHNLEEVASSMELIAQRMRVDPDHRFDLYAWAHDIPILSGATI